MKDKVLETQITAAVESIARALRNYSGRTMSCKIYVETRMSSKDGNDAYGIRVRQKNPHLQIVETSKEIRYTFNDRDGEVIIRTEALPNDIQGKT